MFKKSNGGKDSTSLSKLAVVGKKNRGFKIYFVNFLLLHQLSKKTKIHCYTLNTYIIMVCPMYIFLLLETKSFIKIFSTNFHYESYL